MVLQFYGLSCCSDKARQTNGLKQQRFIARQLLEAGRLRSACGQGRAPSEGSGAGCVPGLPPASGSFSAHDSSIPSSQGVLSVCMSVSKFPLFVTTLVTLD